MKSRPAVLSATGTSEAVEFKDGRTIAAEMVVVAVGIKPNAEIANAAGLAVNRGIIVDDHLSSNTADIFAIGECAEHRGVCYGLVEPAYEQARVLAERLAGRNAKYGGSVNATNLKVSGVHVFSAGDFLGAAGTESIVFADPGSVPTRSWWSLTDSWSAQCCLAIRPTRSGISISSAAAPDRAVPRGYYFRPRAGRTPCRVKRYPRPTGST